MAGVDQFILLRHARAGRKLSNPRKDFERGLDAKGKDVAMRLPRTIESYLRPEAILSSPFLRCVQTVQPLADELDLPISKDDRFTPGRTEASVRQAFLSIPANSVVSTHGEVIAHLFDERVKCAKGAFWLVERRDDQLLPAHYVEAPARQQRPAR